MTGDETSIDCGGPFCLGCGLGKGCQVDHDCESNHCSAENLPHKRCAEGKTSAGVIVGITGTVGVVAAAGVVAFRRRQASKKRHTNGNDGDGGGGVGGEVKSAEGEAAPDIVE